MIEFQLIDKKYMIGNVELTTTILAQYPHTIHGELGIIDIELSVGQKVKRFPSTIHRFRHIGGEEKIISEFTVFGGCLCARFEESNIPHSIDCIEPLTQTSKKIDIFEMVDSITDAQKKSFFGRAYAD